MDRLHTTRKNMINQLRSSSMEIPKIVAIFMLLPNTFGSLLEPTCYKHPGILLFTGMLTECPASGNAPARDSGLIVDCFNHFPVVKEINAFYFLNF